MNIEKIVSELPHESLKTLKDRMANANRVLARDPEHADASRLHSAVQAELTKRKLASRKKVGSLWWEPHDPDLPEFFAYETAEAVVPVAAIFKSDTHTATRKEVYAVRIGNHELTERFAEVAMARQAGSDAWCR
tara:strand:+ start:1210 stop:1611 length:402 start_codon:yes stop_codon:yes gene_type:complete